MNIFQKLLIPDRTVANQSDDSAKRLFQHLSLLLASSADQLETDILFAEFVQREKLGSTYIGHGVAIPHLRSSNVIKPYGTLIQLSNSIDFRTENKETVDLFFGFIVPLEDNDQHLTILACLAEKFNDPVFRGSLRNTLSSEELFNVAIG